MNPITALATITQLLGLFMQERQGQTDLNRPEFMDWLEAHRHEEIKNLISNTYHLSTEFDDILRADHAQILNELSLVNGALAQVMSRLSSFGMGSSHRSQDAHFNKLFHILRRDGWGTVKPRTLRHGIPERCTI